MRWSWVGCLHARCLLLLVVSKAVFCNEMSSAWPGLLSPCLLQHLSWEDEWWFLGLERTDTLQHVICSNHCLGSALVIALQALLYCSSAFRSRRHKTRGFAWHRVPVPKQLAGAGGADPAAETPHHGPSPG